jgi:FHIPEP family
MTATVQIDVSGGLATFAAGERATELARAVAGEVGELSSQLGLTGEVQAQVSASETRRPLRVLVNGVSTPFPPDLLWQLWMEHPKGLPGGDNGGGRSIADDCLLAHCDGNECAPADLARLVVSMIRDRPAALVDDAEAASFAAAAGDRTVPPEAVREVLSSLLELGVAPMPRQDVVEALTVNENRVKDAVEAAFVQLQGRKVEIGLSGPYREQLTGSAHSEPTLVAQSDVHPIARELFDLLDQRLLVEWGLVPPDIVWTTAHDIPDGSILIKVNDRRSAPCRGLDPGDHVLLDGQGELAQGRPKRTILNPANAALELAVVDSTVAAEFESFASAPPAGFAALVVYREMIANAHRLVGSEQVLYLLQDLERRSPELVHVVLRHFTVAEVTQVIRALVRERIPPRLLPMILEQLAHQVVDGTPPDARAEFVRTGLSAYLAERFVGDFGRTFFELPGAVEKRLAAGPTDELYAEHVRDAFWLTLREAAVPPVRAGLIVREAPRAMVYALLEPELAEVVVVRDSELGSELGEPPRRVAFAEAGT